MMKHLDWWILPHLGFFIWLASTIEAAWHPAWWVHLTWAVPLSYAWEVAEYYLQRKFPKIWSNKIETPINSWIIDPTVNLIGVIIGVWVAN